MTSGTEGKVVDDVVKREFDPNYCREKVTVLDGQTFAIGTVGYLNSDNKAVASVVGTNEVQTLNIAGSPSGGTFKLGITIPGTGEVVWTDTIAHNATFATVISNINTALDNVLGASKIVASGSAWTAIVLTFSGTGYSAMAHDEVDVDPAALTGATTAVVTRTTPGHTAGGDCTLIALEAAAPSGADGEMVALVRGPAIVDQNQLAVPTGGLANVVAALKAVNIVALAEPTWTTAT